jgi:hypothetical protein
VQACVSVRSIVENKHRVEFSMREIHFRAMFISHGIRSRVNPTRFFTIFLFPLSDMSPYFPPRAITNSTFELTAQL